MDTHSLGQRLGDREKKTCNQTRAVRSEIIVARHLNDKETLYGGDIMAHFDSAGGSAVYKFSERPTFTASVDTFQFVDTVEKGDAIYVESYVSGAGSTSIEAFVKLISTDLKTFERKLCAYAFLTYVLQDRGAHAKPLPELVPESEEEKTVCAGYEERRKVNLEKREQTKHIPRSVNLLPIWEQRG